MMRSYCLNYELEWLISRQISKKRNIDLSCLNCGEEDRQDHILSCDPIVTKFPETKSIKYQTIFSNNPVELSKTLKVIKKALNHREKLNNKD